MDAAKTGAVQQVSQEGLSCRTVRIIGKSIVQIQSNASLMTFDAGLYCIFMSKPVEHFAAPGFPAVKVTQAPNIPQGLVTISALDEEGIISNRVGAALVRVNRGPAQVLVTTYSLPMIGLKSRMCRWRV